MTMNTPMNAPRELTLDELMLVSGGDKPIEEITVKGSTTHLDGGGGSGPVPANVSGGGDPLDISGDGDVFDEIALAAGALVVVTLVVPTAPVVAAASATTAAVYAFIDSNEDYWFNEE